MPNADADDDARPYPRLAQYREPAPGELPDVTLDDPHRNATNLRHDVKGHLSPLVFLAYEIKLQGHADDAAGVIERAVTALLQTIDLVQVLPPQPQHEYTGPRPPSPAGSGVA